MLICAGEATTAHAGDAAPALEPGAGAAAGEVTDNGGAAGGAGAAAAKRKGSQGSGPTRISGRIKQLKCELSFLTQGSVEICIAPVLVETQSSQRGPSALMWIAGGEAVHGNPNCIIPKPKTLCREKEDVGEQELAVRNIVQLLGGFLGPLDGGAVQLDRAASQQVRLSLGARGRQCFAGCCGMGQ